MRVIFSGMKPLLCGGMALWLSGCISTQSPSPAPSAGDNAGRYAIEQDRAPSVPLDPTAVREVVPVPEARTLAGNRSPYTVNGRTYTVMSSEEGYEAVGIASWYGEKFHGHRTSNGERYDMYQLSAAHRSLPIPGYLRVTNLENQRSIVVRVNDRGPFHSDRIIDLPYAAAYQLGFADRGTARVRLQAIPVESRPVRQVASTGTGRILQLGAFADLAAARRLQQRIQEVTDEVVIVRSEAGGADQQTLHRVRAGPISDSREIETITETMRALNLGQPYWVNE